MSPRTPMPGRNIRIPEPLYQAAKEKAEAKGSSLSEEIRRFLERYVKAK